MMGTWQGMWGNRLPDEGFLPLPEHSIERFCERVRERGDALYRDLPWRNTWDAYEVLVSEVMLQQTQVGRVLHYWQRWLDVFPTPDALAAAPLEVVLRYWQGLGYNRRVIALKNAAEACALHHDGAVPCERADLLALPGVGPATAAGVRVFAYEQPDVYLETNVRAVFIHELFPDADEVADRELIPLVEETCDRNDPRGWYYALLDYGAWLKRALPNPSRRSKHHVRQSAFEGSRRQKRAWLLREVMSRPRQTSAELASALSDAEREAGRDAVDVQDAAGILADLSSEGFIISDGGRWRIA